MSPVSGYGFIYFYHINLGINGHLNTFKCMHVNPKSFNMVSMVINTCIKSRFVQ